MVLYLKINVDIRSISSEASGSLIRAFLSSISFKCQNEWLVPRK
jgi:hypothetical protein